MYSEDYLGLNSRELSRILGYSDPSTMRAVWNATSIPSVDKLVMLSNLKCIENMRLNLDWLFTGDGEPIVECKAPKQDVSATVAKQDLEKRVIRLLKKMTPVKQRSLLQIIQ